VRRVTRIGLFPSIHSQRTKPFRKFKKEKKKVRRKEEEKNEKRREKSRRKNKKITTENKVT
jgi:hypothetical protein